VLYHLSYPVPTLRREAVRGMRSCQRHRTAGPADQSDFRFHRSPFSDKQKNPGVAPRIGKCLFLLGPMEETRFRTAPCHSLRAHRCCGAGPTARVLGVCSGSRSSPLSNSRRRSLWRAWRVVNPVHIALTLKTKESRELGHCGSSMAICGDWPKRPAPVTLGGEGLNSSPGGNREHGD